MALKGTAIYSVLLLFPLVYSSVGKPSTVKLGGLFGNNIVKTVFKTAIDYVNNRTDLLPNHKLEHVIHTHHTIDPYQYVQSGYLLLEHGVSAVVGPGSSSLTRSTHYMFEANHVPQITYSATDSTLITETGLYQYLLKISPPDSVQMEALTAVVEHFKWTQVALLASNNDYGRNAVQDFTKLAIKRNIAVLAEEAFVPKDYASDIDVLPQLNSIKQKAATVIILVTEYLNVPKVLLQAWENGMLDKNYQWILYEPLSELDPELNNGILAVQSASAEGSLVDTYKELMGDSSALSLPPITRTFDSVLAFAYALDKYIKDGHELTPYQYSRINDTTYPWKDGQMLMQYLSQVSGDGVTNDLKFLPSLTPEFAKFNVVNLQKTGWTTIGAWNKKDGLTTRDNVEPIFRGQSKISPVDASYDLTGIHLKVVAILFPPFTIKNTTDGVERLDGYCIELLKKLAEELKFTYTVYLVKDGKFGSQDSTTNEWNGMVGEVLSGNADIGLTALTVTKERLQYIEFSNSYMSAPLGILMAKPIDESLWSFLKPFKEDLWGTFIAALVVFIVIMCIMANCSPYGYGGKFRWRQNKSDMSNKDDRTLFDLVNTAWCIVCTLLYQGPEIFPRSASARIVAAIFWFSVAIFTASYDANLAAFLTVNRLETSITSVYDLANQGNILYGAANDGIEETFFSTTTAEPYPRMYEFMNTHKTWFDSFEEGLGWVRSGKVRGESAAFAMIGDHPYLQYISAAEEPCDTVLARSPFWSGQYAFAFRKNSPYMNAFNLAITKFAQDGWLEEKKTKWVKEGICNNFNPDQDAGTTSSDTLNAFKLRGLFIACAIGFGLGFVVLFMECLVFNMKSKIIKKSPSRQDSNTKTDSFVFHSSEA